MESMLDYDYFDMVCHLDPPKKSNNRPSPDVNDGFHVFLTGAGAALGDWRKRMSHIVPDFFRLQGGAKVAYFTYSALAPTQKTGKKTSQMGYSLTEIALNPFKRSGG
ncbi:hypothetical protein [Desulfosarcina ovata]|uniref:hypothetical protein n=1 Tax=Desulfosarcina ovata TaxID=83564 RepID=UPI0012D2CCC5|nr:hypothetical protein [Desulfosarcina ovata]